MSEDLVSVATKLLKETENRVSADFSYLAYPLGALSPTITDGRGFYLRDGALNVGAENLCETVALDGIKGAERAVLHALLHALCLHPFRLRRPSRIYDAACDIAVGYILDGAGGVPASGLKNRKAVYDAIKAKYGAAGESQAFAYLVSISEEERAATANSLRFATIRSGTAEETPTKKTKATAAER